MVKGSAKVFIKEAFEAIEAAETKKQELKDLKLAQKALKKLETANRKADKVEIELKK